jgi:hypothetical protein
MGLTKVSSLTIVQLGKMFFLYSYSGILPKVLNVPAGAPPMVSPIEPLVDNAWYKFFSLRYTFLPGSNFCVYRFVASMAMLKPLVPFTATKDIVLKKFPPSSLDTT